MSDVLTVTESAMLYDIQRLHSISHNLANSTTVGFKKETTVARPFTDHLTFSAGTASAPLAIKVTRPMATVFTDHSAGALKFTGNPLDIAIEGDGFLVVNTEFGQAYTRHGSLRLDQQGRLVSHAGLAVEGKGGEIRLDTTQPRIDQEGKVWSGDRVVGQIDVVRFSNPANLLKVGGGLYRETESERPLVVDDARLRQGYLEMANVTTMDEMVKMLETVRHFEASQRVLQGYGDMLDSSIRTIADF